MSSFYKNRSMYYYIEETLIDIFNSGGTPNDIKESIECIIFKNESLEKVFDLDFELNATEMGLRLLPTVFEPIKQMIGIGFKTETPEKEFKKGFYLKDLYNNIQRYFGII